eukprot:gene9607-12938_t
MNILDLPPFYEWNDLMRLLFVQPMTTISISLTPAMVYGSLFITAILSYRLHGRYRNRYFSRAELKAQKNALETQLEQAQHIVRDLEDKLLCLELDSNQLLGMNREVRIWVDGAFDMMHYGHMNAFRQARALGTKLIVGVNSEETIIQCKGKPVCSTEERVESVRGCKWVDEVIEDVPYILNEEYIQEVVLKKYKIDYIVHGDDPCIVDGKDVYESAKKMGKFLTIPRTEGISTTDIVGRMLLMTRSHHSSPGIEIDEKQKKSSRSTATDNLASGYASKPFTRKSNFLTTSLMIRFFSAGVQSPKPNDKIVYIAGAWDMFHLGHIRVLEAAKKLGQYLIVGIHNDSVVNEKCGLNLPIMNLNERVLSVLGCKWVNDVLIDAPYNITQEMISSLKINVVAMGDNKHTHQRLNEEQSQLSSGSVDNIKYDEDDGYDVPREMGILQVIHSESSINVLDFVDRIQNHRERFSTKYQSKMDNTSLDFALFNASRDGNEEMVRSLIEDGADVNHKWEEEYEYFALNIASFNGHFGVVKLLIENRADVNTANKELRSPLYSASREGHFDIVKLLIDNQADVHQENYGGYSPLNAASSKGHSDIVKLLIDNHVDINKTNIDGWSPLNAASSN